MRTRQEILVDLGAAEEELGDCKALLRDAISKRDRIRGELHNLMDANSRKKRLARETLMLEE